MLKYELIDNQKEEWVVFVHGLGGSTKTWNKQIEEFSENYNLLLLDLPGHGSNADNIIQKVSPKKLHKGIKETLDYLHIEHAHFVGLSLGTLVIAQFAICFPQYVDTIILGGPSLKLTNVSSVAVICANKIKGIVPYESLYQFFAWFMMPKKNHEHSRKIFLREVVKLDKDTMFAWIEYLQYSLKPEKLLQRLDVLGKKVLFISGDEDHCFLDGARSIAKKAKNMELKIIDKCGHICSIESWKNFNQLALDHLKHHGKRSHGERKEAEILN
jgi:pimeloyl-ACP methyl ester carboxylesterase